MTKEERVAKMAELRKEVEENVKKYNEFMLDEKLKDANDLVDPTQEKINEYTKYAREIAFEECKNAEDPMLEACKRLTFDTIRTKDEKVDDSKIMTRVVEDTTKVIDLQKLMKYCGGKLGKDPKWIHALEQFNFRMTAKKAVELGIDPKEINDSYAMSAIAKEYDLGKDPASKTNLLKTLTKIIAMMIGEEYKPVSHDINYLLSIYSKKNRSALSVTCANHRYMRQYVEEICYRIINGLTYDVQYKKEK